MPYYIVESSERDLTIGGVTLTGVPTTGHSRHLWLFVVNTKENPPGWPASPTGRGSKSPRRSPDGVKDWWVATAWCQSAVQQRVALQRQPLARAAPGLPGVRLALIRPGSNRVSLLEARPFHFPLTQNPPRMIAPATKTAATTKEMLKTVSVKSNTEPRTRATQAVTGKMVTKNAPMQILRDLRA